MTTVTLVYPYFQPKKDNSVFRFPPLGLGYIAAYLRKHDIRVQLVDCTFLSEKEALCKIRNTHSTIIGIQAMFSMKEEANRMADLLRNNCDLLVVGGPLSTTNPGDFLDHFDVAVMGEGEETMLQIARMFEAGLSLSTVDGIAFKDKNSIKNTAPRSFIKDLDAIPFPSRDLFDNQSYKDYYRRNFGYTTSSIMTSRGCPFNCDFCSRPVFGNDFRSRTAMNIVEEIDEIKSLGYSRIWFADDCFTLGQKRLIDICDKLIDRHVNLGWECLSRVDTIDREVAAKMKQAGCIRVFFGIESGNDDVLRIMKKQVTAAQAAKAVRVCNEAGIRVGAFFIVGYPGESEKSLLDTLRFSSSLDLDYLSFTLPYPIPGTMLFERVRNKMFAEDWSEPKGLSLVKHGLLFKSPLSESKLKLAIMKGMSQFYLRKYLGHKTYGVVGKLFENSTDALLKVVQ